MKRVMTLCVLVLTLTMALCPAALADRTEAVFFFVSAGCSTRVFHARQAGHWPAHLAVSLPHSVQ